MFMQDCFKYEKLVAAAGNVIDQEKYKSSTEKEFSRIVAKANRKYGGKHLTHVLYTSQ